MRDRQNCFSVIVDSDTTTDLILSEDWLGCLLSLSCPHYSMWVQERLCLRRGNEELGMVGRSQELNFPFLLLPAFSPLALLFFFFWVGIEMGRVTISLRHLGLVGERVLIQVILLFFNSSIWCFVRIYNKQGNTERGKNTWRKKEEIHNAMNLFLVVEEELSHFYSPTSHLWTHALFILKRENIGLFCIKQDNSNSISCSSTKQRKREIVPFH